MATLALGDAPRDSTGESFETFGEYLKYLRRRARLTQSELGRAVGYSREQIVRLEHNQRFPDPATLNALFIPALELQHNPASAARLIELAARAREKQETVPHNLPPELTSFIGRDKEIAEIVHRLTTGKKHRDGAAPAVRLLTLTGVGGTGKTRLALQAAHALLPSFRDGVWFVELAHIGEATLVTQSVAATMGLREQTGHTFCDALMDFLRAKNTLLVLDNCEHLLDACAELADAALRAAPALKIMATSRQALGIAGEHSYPVRPLALPVARESLPELLKQSDAVRLFLDRAVAVQPDFHLTFENASAVVQICARLDGIPLAIELAAARVKGLSVEQIAARLDDRFRLLTGGSRTARPRQRTLQATIDWSYALLSDQERVLLRRLAVFNGTWTVQAAEAICSMQTANNGDEPSCSAECQPLTDVTGLMLGLVDKSLVVAETGEPESRLRMLETIRQYAQEKLDASGEGDAVRTRHLEFFADLGRQARPHLQSSGQVRWLRCLDAEHDNIHASLRWALASGNTASGLALATDLQMFWVFRAYLHEPRILLEQLLEADSAADMHTRARAHFVAGLLEMFVGNGAAARAHAFKSEALSLKLGTAGRGTLGFARNLLVYTLPPQERDPARAQECFQENIRLFREAGEQWGEAHTIFNLGEARFRAGDFEGAEQAYTQSLTLFRELGDEFRAMQQIAVLALIANAQGRYALARSQLEQVLAYFRSMRYNIDTDHILATLGAIAIHEGDYARARVSFADCLRLDRQMGVYTQFIQCLTGFSAIALAEKQFQRAAHLLGAVEAERGLVLPEHAEQQERANLIMELRNVLGPDELELALALGRTLSRDQAIDLALKNE